MTTKLVLDNKYLYDPASIIDVPVDNLMQVYKTCLQLQELCEKENGVGISAVQAGIPWKLFLVRQKFEPKSGFDYFINCKYSPLNDIKFIHLEGCLSLRDAEGKSRTFSVERFKAVSIDGFKLVSEPELRLDPVVNYHATGFRAAVFQHEIQHQQAITIDKIGTELGIW